LGFGFRVPSAALRTCGGGGGQYRRACTNPGERVTNERRQRAANKLVTTVRSKAESSERAREKEREKGGRKRGWEREIKIDR